MTQGRTAANRTHAPSPAPVPPPVSATFVFVDALKMPIQGVEVKVQVVDGPSASGITDDKGFALKIENLQKGKSIEIYVKKKTGVFDLKGKVTPKHDINNYTIMSPELHFDATTRLTPKQELEENLHIPTIADGEVLTAARLFGDLAPFIGSVEKITEVGEITKDFPTKTIAQEPDAATGGTKPVAHLEHHFKVVKTDKPKTILVNLLGSRLNYPVSEEISDSVFTEMATTFGCELAAIKAVTYTEAGGSGFSANGLPKILFERHKFFAFTDPNRNAAPHARRLPHPYAQYSDICNPTPGGYGGDQYVRLIKAARLDRDAAIMACSWGAFQVLAEYYASFGYATPSALVDDCLKSVDGHVRLFKGFLGMPEKKRAVDGLKAKDWVKFTTYYNGGNWRAQNPDYPDKMQGYYDQYKTN